MRPDLDEPPLKISDDARTTEMRSETLARLTGVSNAAKRRFINAMLSDLYEDTGSATYRHAANYLNGTVVSEIDDSAMLAEVKRLMALGYSQAEAINKVTSDETVKDRLRDKLAKERKRGRDSPVA